MGCNFLANITIPSNVTEIPIAFFRNCNKLEEVSFTSSIRYIKQNAFYGCSSLVSIGSLSSIRELGAYAFNGCSSLKQIFLPTTCSKMYINCFKGCISLHIYSEASEWPSTWFSNATFNPDNRPIYWYSKTPNYDGTHWRYVSGVPTIWA